MVTIMAHFAEIDKNNKVIRVLLIPDEQEKRGQIYLAKDLNLGGTWIQTSYNNNIRGKYAGISDFYDAEKDEFIAEYVEPTLELLIDETIPE
jgi:hypothetical protein